MLRIAYYGDDFTGATDTLATATQGGLRTLLFLRVPSAEMLAAAGELDCVGIAGASRSMGPSDMENELGPVADCFARLGAPVVHYKTCSTFDSSPGTGNIAVALRVLTERVPSRFVPIVGGQPNIGRYCAFGHLFAAAQAGGPVLRIDRHPMAHHPVTPMTESDLRLHFERLGLAGVVSVPYPAYESPELAHPIAQAARDGAALLFDVTRVADLAPVGRIIWHEAQERRIVVAGPSGVTQALCAHWHETGTVAASVGAARIRAAQGPVLVVAGSLSPVTRRQIEVSDFSRVALDPRHVTESLQRVTGLLMSGHSVIAHTAPLDDCPIDGSLSGLALAQETGKLVAAILSKVKVSRLGVAGGDTSSWVLRALDIAGLSFVGHLAPGVALCGAHATSPDLNGLEIMLKGGQMGPLDLFRRLRDGD